MTSDVPPAQASFWDAAVSAASLLAIDPGGLGGLRLRGSAGPARDRLLAIYAGLLPAGAPVRKLPPHVADGRLLGGLDLAATLASGRPAFERGLLAEADGGALTIGSAEQLSAGFAGRLAAALDNGAQTVERDGFAFRLSTRFAVIACDEALPDEEPPPNVLTERLGLVISLSGVTLPDLEASPPDRSPIDAARERLTRVSIDDGSLEALAEAALRIGVVGLRPLLFAAAAARASAAIAGRDLVAADDLAVAARLVLGPRATQSPSQAEDDEREPRSEAEEPRSRDAEAGPAPDEMESDARNMADTVLEAAVTALPSGLLDAARSSAPGRSATSAAGRSGASRGSRRRGRPIGSRAGAPGDGARLDLLETLKAAAPWRSVRQRDAGARSGRIIVRREDFRVKRLKEKRRTVTIFAVDASGSAALHRLAEAKGAVELLLSQSYVRRDEVALVAFRGAGAEIMLPPTRSLARAKRALSGLPGGGGTPLASGLDAATALAEHARRRGDQPTVVVLTDGAANVARDGTGGRARAHADAVASATTLKALGVPAILIDVSPRPADRAREIAGAMAARYVALPSADASSVAREIARGCPPPHV